MKTCSKVKNGVILPIVLVAIVAITIVGAATLRAGAHARMRAIHAAHELAGRSAADAGMAIAIQQVNYLLENDAAWDGYLSASDVSLPGASATYSYTVVPSLAGFEITSTGAAGTVEKNAHCIMRFESFWVGLSVLGHIWFGNNATFAVWDGSSLDIRTSSSGNNSIRIRNNPEGDIILLIPPGSDPDSVVSMGRYKTGDFSYETIVMPDNTTYPSITPPSGAEFLGPAGSAITAGVLSQSGKYEGISLGHNQNLLVNGDVTVYITGDISIGNNSEIAVSKDSSLTIYTDGSISMGNNSRVISQNSTPSEQATAIKILGTDTCTSIELANLGGNKDALFHGAIYAPNASLESRNNTRFIGALMVKDSTMGNNAEIVYVKELLNEVGENIPKTLKLHRWWEQ